MGTTAFDLAVRLLKGRSKSRARLEQALRRRGHGAVEVEAALRRAAELGYLDDARHAALKARVGLAQGRSLDQVRRRLEAEGIDEGTAAAAARAAAHEAGHDEAAAARALLERRKLSGPRAARLLASRGFTADVIEKLLGGDFAASSG